MYAPRCDRTTPARPSSRLLAGAPDAAARPGSVHVVGAGPGDPGLLTVRARDLLLQAQVVFHDALVSSEVLSLCCEGAELVDVGKRGGGSQTSQEDITASLIAAARSGQEVVRLKGGDPFVFGRGGEVAVLRAAGITVDVVSGVSSAIAAPAAADIPVTMRGVSGSVAVVAGQDMRGILPDNLERIAGCVDTLVVLMPMSTLDEISARLVPVLGGDRPAAIIADATTADQRVLRAPLGGVAAPRARRASPPPQRWWSGTW